ncbi:hypothetical protein AAVH_29662 [Aphelenchoides avenae]|nr:hypothetical protein AAVH_29662 [Aphelenchus avenae]
MAGVVALMGFVDSMFLYLAVLSVPDQNEEFGRLMSHPMWQNVDGQWAVFFGMEKVWCHVSRVAGYTLVPGSVPSWTHT